VINLLQTTNMQRDAIWAKFCSSKNSRCYTKLYYTVYYL